MAVEKRLIPYELLHRWNADTGEYQASHVIFIEEVLADGAVVARTLLGAMTPEQASEAGFPFPDVLTRAHTDALIALDQANARVAELEREAVATAEAHAAEIQAKDGNLQALLGEVEALKAEADAMQAALTEAQKEANAGFFTKFANLFIR